MGTILTRKGERVLVDNSLLEELSSRAWHVNHGYVKARYGDKVLQMHRVVIGAKPGQIVDHVNGDKLDNRGSNLRFCTHAENMANRKVNHQSASGYKGVTFDRSMSRRKRWGASIHHDGRRIKIGRYFTAEEAAKAYDNIAFELKGQFARLNFRRIES